MSDRLTNFQNAIAILPRLKGMPRVLGQDVYDIGSLSKDATPERRRGWAFMGTRPLAPRRAAVAIVSYANSIFVLLEIEPRITTPRNGRADQFALPILRNPNGQIPDSTEIQELLDSLIDVDGVVTNKKWKLCQFGTWFHNSVLHVFNEQSQRYAQRIMAHL